MNCSFPVLHCLPEFAVVLGSLLFCLLQGIVSGDSKQQDILTTGRNASKPVHSVPPAICLYLCSVISKTPTVCGPCAEAKSRLPSESFRWPQGLHSRMKGEKYIKSSYSNLACPVEVGKAVQGSAEKERRCPLWGVESEKGRARESS